MIYVISHKKINSIPNNYYRTMEVGAAKKGKESFAWSDFQDNEIVKENNDNISFKNQQYCELTGIYWLWKHSRDDIIGICHYRRFFTINNRFSPDLSNIVDENYVKEKLSNHDIILPLIHNFRLPVFHYSLRIYGINEQVIIDELQTVLKNIYPEYCNAFEEVSSSCQSYVWNMMICKKNVYDEYCTWLFDILFALERTLNKRLDFEYFTTAQKRLYGYLSERLLTVWIKKNNLKIFECQVMFTEEDRSIKGKIQKWLHYKTGGLSSNKILNGINYVYDKSGHSNKFMKK